MKSLFNWLSRFSILLFALLLCDTLFPFSASAQKRITINEGETLIGFYTTDELPNFGANGASVAGIDAGTNFAGVVFHDEVVGKYVGGEIVRYRFAIASETPVYRGLIYKVPVVDNTLYDLSYSELIMEIDLSGQDIVVGWNDVELPEPLPIEDADYHYMLGYEYEQVSGEYPLAVDRNLNADYTPSWGGIVVHESGYWDNFTGCSLCIQAVVRGGDNIVGKDISLFNLSTDDNINDINDVEYSFRIRNSGTESISSYTLKVTLDGEEVETMNTPVALTNSYQTISRTILTDELEYGEHTLTVSVVDIDGVTPTENTNDDYLEKTFILYGGSISRQMHLIEQFTSVHCRYCPYGHDLIETMQEMYPDKYAWISCHYFMGSADPFEIDKASYIKTFSGTSTYPRAAFDRCYLEDSQINSEYSMSITMSWGNYQHELVATLINSAVDDFYAAKTAYATVDIDSEYDASTRQLTVTVSGVGVKGAQSLLSGQRLTVCLTEDGLVYPQLQPDETYVNDYVHDNVLRDIISTYPWGDDINWTSSSGYSNTITYTLDKEWDADNMHIVAFISGPMCVLTTDGWVWGDPLEGYLHNANMAKLGESSTISGIVDGDTSTEPGPVVDPDTSGSDGISAVGNDVTISSYYTADGYRVDAPVKGVNIVKLSDGSTRKIVVK